MLLLAYFIVFSPPKKIDQKVDDLLNQMTLKGKTGQLNQ